MPCVHHFSPDDDEEGVYIAEAQTERISFMNIWGKVKSIERVKRSENRIVEFSLCQSEVNRILNVLNEADVDEDSSEGCSDKANSDSESFDEEDEEEQPSIVEKVCMSSFEIKQCMELQKRVVELKRREEIDQKHLQEGKMVRRSSRIRKRNTR
jgi:hypothetical protein